MQRRVQTPRASQGLPTLDCDSAEVSQILREIADTVLATGGRLSSLLEIRERQGQLTGHATDLRGADESQAPLIVLNDTAMPPVSAGAWSWDGERLHVVTDPGLEAQSARLLDLHAALYTATTKPRWYRTTHPRGALSNDATTVQAIHALRPHFAIDPSPAGFLATRVFKRGDAGAPSLIPIADVLNHHRSGARLAYAAGKLAIDVRQPIGTTECFVNYGSFRRDPLDLALQYGYADGAVTVASSAPLSVEVSGLGPVEVLRRLTTTQSPIDPPTIQRTSDGWSLSHITLQAENPERLLVPIRLMTEAAGASDPEATARELLSAVIDKNLALLSNLVGTLDMDTPMGSMLTKACGHQARNFERVATAVN